MANAKGSKARFGNVRRLPSGRVQARYTGRERDFAEAHRPCALFNCFIWNS